MEQRGRLTLPTDADMVEETLRLKELLGADALRDCDGTTMPDELLSADAKKYATYYTTRKDNEWAKANPEEIQQEYLISDRITARSNTLRIRQNVFVPEHSLFPYQSNLYLKTVFN